MNNLDLIYKSDTAEFSRRYLDYLGDVLNSIDTDSIARFIQGLLKN